MNNFTGRSGIQMIGTQRSGSNLLRVILDQSPEIASPHPPHILVVFYPLLPFYGTLDAENYRRLIHDVVRYVQANPVAWLQVILDEQWIFDHSMVYSLFEINRLIYEQSAVAKGASYWCCKSMANVHFSRELDRHSPDLKYIYLYRDGRDVALSFKKAIVGDKHIYPIARGWHKDQQACLQLQKKLPATRFYALNYETLITDPENTVRELCSFLHIPFADRMLTFYSSTESRNTAAAGEMWKNIEKPILSNNTKKYLAGLSREEIAVFECVAGKSLASLGYELCGPTGMNGLSDADIEKFERANDRLKQEAIDRASETDKEKRQPQLDIIKEIKSRMTSFSQ